MSPQGVAKTISRLWPTFRISPWRYRRHLRVFLQHGTPQRWVNLIRVELERLQRARLVKGRPYLIFADPTNTCNLRCPLCATGSGRLRGRQAYMGMDTFRRVIDQVAPFALEVFLYNWGEPLLHPHLFDMISHARECNLATNLSSNLNLVRSGDIDGLLDSGLEYLCVSLDGVTQEVYETYRVGGSLQRVLANLKELLEQRHRRGQRIPIVEWQFIVMKHNEHQVPVAKKIARELGVDLIRFVPVVLPFDAPNKPDLARVWFPGNPRFRYHDPEGEPPPFRGDNCFFLYRSLVVHPDGSVAPCCNTYDTQDNFGSLREQDLDQIWNNAPFRSARGLFAGVAPEQPTACDRCDLFAKRWLGKAA